MAPPFEILHVFATFATGGPQVRAAAILNHYGRRWRHRIIAMDGNYACRERLGPDVAVEYPKLDLRKGDTRHNVALIRHYCRTAPPDALVTSNWGSIEWAMANLLPPRLHHVHMEDGFGPDEAQGQQPRRIWTRRLVLRRSEIVLPSQVLFGHARDLWKLPARRLHYVPNGLDLGRFRPDGPRAELAVPGTGPLIGTVAALRREKNLGRLLRALALLRQQGIAARLAMIGDGGERAALEAETAALGLGDQVRFLGHVPDPAAAYRAMDLFALSSDTEQMPFSVMEAMASGLAVAATAVGDVPLMLAEANRPCVVPKEDAALAGALAKLLGDADLRARLGAANRAKAERDYDQEVMFATYAALIEGRAPAAITRRNRAI
jgi:glycosyltransferase involved in cell wall biosynthesis